MPSSKTALLSLALFLAAATTPAAALADEASCNVDKLKSLSKVTKRLLVCSSKSIASSSPLDPACSSEADTDLAGAFAEAQADPECAASGEAADIQDALHDLEADLRAALVVTMDGRKCASGKMRAVAVAAKKHLTCIYKAARNSEAPDPACQAKASDKLTSSFAYREQHGSCETTGDSAAVALDLDTFLDFSVSKIDGTYVDSGPSNLVADVAGGDIDLTWTAGADYTHARVLRRLNAAVSGPTDPSAAVVFFGTASSAADDLTALLPSTTATMRTYHYAVYGCDSMGTCETTGSAANVAPTVREALIGGGYVIHWRHADADVCSDNQSLGKADVTMYPDWWKSCDSNCGTATARQMNAQGVIDATNIGDAFDTLGIPVGRVLSSEYCRNVATAQLMDFGPVIEESQELTYWVYDEANRCADTFVMLGEAPTAGTNTALIGHAGNTCPPLHELAWGEAAIYKPDGMGGTIYIDRVTENAWLSLP